MSTVAAAVGGLLCGRVALAQTPPAPPVIADASASSEAGLPSLQQVVVTTTASRATSSTVEKSASPIVVVTSTALLRTGQQNLRDALADIYPSYSNLAGYQGQQGEGVKVATLDGLDPKDVLVLVNGKRRHKTALYLNGEAPVDLDLIPVSAVDHIEILKDGAAAQYGSDAIAGVINIILKKDDEGGSATVGYGQYGSSVGTFTNLKGRGGVGQFDQGFKLGDGGGFLNVSGSVDVHKATNVYGPYPLSSRIYPLQSDGEPSALETSLSRYRQIEGQPAVQDYDLGYNAELPIGSDVTLYSFSTLAYRYSQGWGFFRTAISPQTYPDVYPNGFMPEFESAEYDYQPVVGLKGDELLGWKWDLSSTYGVDNGKIYTDDSLNASLGPAYEDIHDFYDGRVVEAEWINDFDVNRDVETGLFANPLTISAGLEYRRETFSVDPGQWASYADGTFVWPAGTLNAGIAPNPGASGMDGYSPQISGSWSRDVQAVYVDINQALTDAWNVDLAGRYERYSDFGGVPSGKLATRYQISPAVAIRGTASNGFSAPTLQQEHYALSTGGYTTDPTTGLLTQEFTDLAPPTSAIATALGATALRPEHSTNFSLGLVITPVEGTTATVDGYIIDIRNRIIETPTLEGSTVVGLLQAAGFSNVTEAEFFTNAAHTVTRGGDLSIVHLDDFGELGRVKWTLASTENVTSVVSLAGIPPALANSGIAWSSSIYSELTQYYPKNVTSLSGHWIVGKVDLDLVEKHFSSTNYVSPSGSELDQHSSPAFITDLDVGYSLTAAARLSIGATNFFNKRPNEQTPSAIKYGSVPSAYPVYVWYAPYGNDGGYYYARFEYSW